MNGERTGNRVSRHGQPTLLAAGAVAYVLLSVTCFTAPGVPWLLALAQSNTPLLWLLGPPALLLYGTTLLWLYAPATAAVWAALASTQWAARRDSPACFLWAIVAGLTWVGSGLLVYVPGW